MTKHELAVHRAAMRCKKLRPEVEIFARMMEYKLRLNDHKINWRKCKVAYLIACLQEEVNELKATFPHDQRAALFEAADVANFVDDDRQLRYRQSSRSPSRE